MKLIVNSQGYDDPSPLNKGGGEGELYALDTQNVAKVYFPNVLQNEPWRAAKVLALCNSFDNMAAKGTSTSIAAFPEFPAYRDAVILNPDAVVGFSMHWFKDCPSVHDLRFDLATNGFREEKGVKFNDQTALVFVYDMFAAVDQLHGAARVVLGDVNDENILYNPKTEQPVIIDIDSAQVEEWPCPMTHQFFSDPQLVHRRKNRKGLPEVDAGTDTFALAVVCFEFLIGKRPFEVNVDPTHPDGEIDNKMKGISSIKCAEYGCDYLRPLGYSYVDCVPNKAVEKRLSRLKTLDRRLYDFFVGVFVHGERESLLFSLDPLKDTRHPGHRLLVARLPDSGATKVVDDVAAKRDRRAKAHSGRADRRRRDGERCRCRAVGGWRGGL